MKAVGYLTLVFLLSSIAASHGLDFLDLSFLKKIKKSTSTLRGSETSSNDKATSEVTFLDIGKDNKAKSEGKKEAGVLEEFTPDTVKEKGAKDRKSSKSQATTANGPIELLDLNSKPATKKSSGSKDVTPVSKEGEELDLSALAAPKGKKPVPLGKDGKKIDFIDINTNANDASTKKKDPARIIKNKVADQKVDFVDLNTDSKDTKSTKKSGKTTTSEKKPEFIDLSGTENKKAEKKAPTAPQQQKVEFVDVVADDKKTQTQTTKASSPASTEKKAEKIDFVDLNSNSNAEPKKAAPTAAKGNEKIEFVNIK